MDPSAKLGREVSNFLFARDFYFHESCKLLVGNVYFLLSLSFVAYLDYLLECFGLVLTFFIFSFCIFWKDVSFVLHSIANLFQ